MKSLALSLDQQVHEALAFSQLNLCFKTIIRISKGEALYFFFF